LLGFAVLATMGCRGQSIEARSRFVEDGVTKATEADWDGQSIEIQNAGVTLTGGLQLLAGATSRVSATARMLAIADTEDKASADQAIIAAKETFQVVTDGAVTSARCGNGPMVESVAPADSGCDALDVSLPVGTDAKPLMVAARSAIGLVVVSLADAVLGALDLEGSQGAIDVKVPSRAGAVITVVSKTGDVVMLNLPADFAADVVVLEAPPEQIDTTAFPDLVNGKGRGEAGRGAKSITVRAGRIVLVRR
jgi:hypothetical protein